MDAPISTRIVWPIAAAAVLLGACTSGDDTARHAAATATVTTTVTATSGATKAPTPPANGDALASMPTAVRLDRTGSLYFRTPSRNIECWLNRSADSQSVDCVPAAKDYPDPVDFGCQVDVVSLFHLDGEGAQYGSCQGDVVGMPGRRVLEYGTAAAGGAIICGSQTTGVTCVDSDTEHGFTVSRKSYTIF